MYVKNVKTVSGGSVGRACQYDHIVKMYHIFSVSPVGGGYELNAWLCYMYSRSSLNKL